MLKILHLTRRQWDDLPWHDQKMYIDQLNKDPEYNEDGDSSGAADTVELTSWDDLPSGT